MTCSLLNCVIFRLILVYLVLSFCTFLFNYYGIIIYSNLIKLVLLIVKSLCLLLFHFGKLKFVYLNKLFQILLNVKNKVDMIT